MVDVYKWILAEAKRCGLKIMGVLRVASTSSSVKVQTIMNSSGVRAEFQKLNVQSANVSLFRIPTESLAPGISALG